MIKHENFKKGEITFNLGHLDGHVFKITRQATETHPEKNINVWITFSNHCFTGHFAKNDDEEWIYPSTSRYFCPVRYEHSKHLPALIPYLINENIHLLKTNYKHKEQFYHLNTTYLDINYSVFLEIDKSTSPKSDLRIKVVSAYEQDDWANKVSGKARFKFWSIIEARLTGVKLEYNNRRRRR